jgi:hypothetical protein
MSDQEPKVGSTSYNLGRSGSGMRVEIDRALSHAEAVHLLQQLINLLQPQIATTDVEKAFDLFEEMCRELEFEPPQALTAIRRRLLRARLISCGGLDGWRAVMARIHESGLLSGRKKDWHVTLDWLLQPDKFTRVIEGAYRDYKATERPKSAYELLCEAMNDPSGYPFDMRKR